MDVDTGLIAHWPLDSDCEARGGDALESRACNVEMRPAGPGAPGPTAAFFNGIDSQIVVPDHPRLHLGSSDFSIAVWLHTDAANGDVVGDVVSKFDPAARRGFGLGIVSNIGVTTTAQANCRNIQFGIDQGRVDAAWTDRGRPGNAAKVMALHVSGGDLFAGTFELEADQTGHLWRYAGDRDWQDLGATPDGSNAVPTVARHEGALYCGTGRYNPLGSCMGEARNPKPGGKVYRIESDGKWTDCGRPGGDDATPEEKPVSGYETGKADDVAGLTVFRGDLYCTSNHRRGAFRYEGGKDWRYIGPDRRILSFTIFRRELYALINGGPVYRYREGADWEHCGGPATSSQTYSAATHYGELYVGTWPEGEVYRYDGGQAWAKVARLGYEREVMGMAAYNQKMYAGTLPMANVWRLDDGGFTFMGNLDPTPTAFLRRVWSMAVYNGKLYGGTLPSGHVLSLGAGVVASCDRALPTGWRHLAAVRQGDRLRLYLDGQPAGESETFAGTDYDLTAAGRELTIGFGGHTWFHGAMSDLRLYDRPLAPAEAEALAAL